MNRFVEWFMGGGRKLPAGDEGLLSVDDRVVDRIESYKNYPRITTVSTHESDSVSIDISYVELTIRRGKSNTFTLEPGEVAEMAAAEQFDILSGAYLPNVYTYPTAFFSNRMVHVELVSRSMGVYRLMVKNNGELPITIHGGDPIAWLSFGYNPIEVSYR